MKALIIRLLLPLLQIVEIATSRRLGTQEQR